MKNNTIFYIFSSLLLILVMLNTFEIGKIKRGEGSSIIEVKQVEQQPKITWSSIMNDTAIIEIGDKKYVSRDPWNNEAWFDKDGEVISSNSIMEIDGDYLVKMLSTHHRRLIAKKAIKGARK